MMDNLNLKPKSPDEVKTMMWTGENQREMFDLLTCGKKIDDYMTASGENFFIDHSTVKGGLVLITNVGNQCRCEIPVKIGGLCVWPQIWRQMVLFSCRRYGF